MADGLPDVHVTKSVTEERDLASRRVALVTGASQGIGAATALALAREGCEVAVSSTRPEKLSTLLDLLAAAGCRALPVALDVCLSSSIEAAVAAVIAAFGRLDVLINNAGMTLRRSAVDVTLPEWDAVMRTNVTGTYFMSQQMGRHLIGNRRAGCIISIASTFGVIGAAGRSAYGISKAAIIHMTRMLAIEWAEHGIRVNAIAPGRVDTPSRAGSYLDPGFIEAALRRVPLHRFASSEEVAAAACYLASPQAAYITGQTLIMDGGLTAY